jgi:hypothetical protein
MAEHPMLTKDSTSVSQRANEEPVQLGDESENTTASALSDVKKDGTEALTGQLGGESENTIASVVSGVKAEGTEVLTSDLMDLDIANDSIKPRIFARKDADSGKEGEPAKKLHRKALIAYGSETGTALMFAEEVEDILRHHRFATKLAELDAMSPVSVFPYWSVASLLLILICRGRSRITPS